MNRISTIRAQLGVTQTAMADALHVTQGNISHYERGQGVPPEVAKRLIAFALTLGHTVSFDDIYGPPLTPPSCVGDVEPLDGRAGRPPGTMGEVLGIRSDRAIAKTCPPVGDSG